MEDIKIASRGGMKLSELLPNWSLKNVRSSNATGTISFSGNACPKGSKYGIVLVPTVIQGGAGHGYAADGPPRFSVKIFPP